VGSGDDALRELCFADRVFRKRYEGWAFLGRGSFATVVRTLSRDAGREVALKVFVDLPPEAIARIRDEVRAVQRLADPHVVQTYSVFHEGSLTWFEMELVEGGSLQQELDRMGAGGGGPSLPRAHAIALAVSRCLWHAHQREVLHGDVKPANILLPASGRPAAKVADFGIARLAHAASATPAGLVTGTPRFASPEALGRGPVGKPHDVYCLCTTLYALFSGGRLPFAAEGDSSVATLRRLKVESRPTPLRRLRPELDPRMSRIIMKGLSPRPSARPGVDRIVLALERLRR
jgi:serine/threonine-protein kinase